MLINIKIIVIDFAGIDPHYAPGSQRLRRKNAQIYSCDHCSYATRISSRFTDHLRTHTGERPYKCPVCDQRFSVKSNMLRHLNSHKVNDKDAFICRICHIPFNTLRALSNHAKHHSFE